MLRALIISSVVVLSASQVFASKARLDSLQGAAFLKDSQTIFTNPAHVNGLGKYLTFEFGGATNSASPKGEAGLFVEDFGANVGVYLGHVDETQTTLRDGTFENQNNPVEIFYAKDNWGASVSISNYDDKNAKNKEQTIIARYGVDNGDSEYYGSLAIIASGEAAGDKYTGAPVLTAGYEKADGTTYYVGEVIFGNTKTDISNAEAKTTTVGLSVGALSRKYENIYYGAYLQHLSSDTEGTKDTALLLPLVAGIEANLNSWATFRASVEQSFLLSTVKAESAGAGSDKEVVNTNDTTVAAGVGLKYGSFTLDGVLAMSSTGNINGNAVLTQASVTYTF